MGRAPRAVKPCPSKSLVVILLTRLWTSFGGLLHPAWPAPSSRWSVRENNSKPDWFPLPVHLEKPATLEHWARCIALRLGITGAPQSDEWKATSYRSIVIADKGTDWSRDRTRLLGVNCMTAFEAFQLADAVNVPANSSIRKLSERETKGDRDFSEGACELKRTLGEIDTDRFFSAFAYRLPVMVNLALDDATLRSHFDVWLRMMRNQIIEAAGPIKIHRIDDAFLERCHAMRVLAAFDLLTWRNLTGATYPDAAIASWLWPDAGPLSDGTFADRGERFRKVTKPLLDSVMVWTTVERIEQRQAEANFIETEVQSRPPVPERRNAKVIPEHGRAA